MNPATQYWGRPCKHGHGASEGRCPRSRASGTCVMCKNEWQRTAMRTNPEYAEKQRAAIRAANARRRADPEGAARHREYQRLWVREKYRTDPEYAARVRASSARYASTLAGRIAATRGQEKRKAQRRQEALEYGYA